MIVTVEEEIASECWLWHWSCLLNELQKLKEGRSVYS